MSVELNGQRINALVLDFDKTFYVVDDEAEERIFDEARRQLVAKILEEKNISPTPEKITEWLKVYIDLAKKISWKPAFIELGGKKEDFINIISRVPLKDYLEYDESLVIFLNQVLKQIPVYIFTGSHSERVIEALQVLIGSMWDQFVYQRILAINHMKNGLKPDLEAYEEMLEKFRINPETTIFVDDQLAEVESAASLGLITFLIQHESKDSESMLGSHIVINSLADLANHIQII